MSNKSFDIDIDTPSNFNPLSIFPFVVRASVVREKVLTPHPCGVYFQNIPIDPLTHLSAIEYESAEALNFFKIDFLHLNVYDAFSSKDDIRQLLKQTIDWNLLKIPSVVKDLFQLSKHYDLLQELQPTSEMELADVLALIRPQKRYLLDFYKKNKDQCRKLLYTKESGDAYSFKKAHAIAYALVIVLQLHLISKA